jgi:hypothetical protein
MVGVDDSSGAGGCVRQFHDRGGLVKTVRDFYTVVAGSKLPGCRFCFSGLSFLTTLGMTNQKGKDKNEN